MKHRCKVCKRRLDAWMFSMTRFSKTNKHVCIDCYSNIQLKKRFIEERKVNKCNK